MTNKVYICNSCGYESTIWEGKCRSCGEWNSYVEETVILKKDARFNKGTKRVSESKPREMSDILTEPLKRISTNIVELDRVLSGGLIKGQVILLSGNPGVGKSTLLLELADSINKKVLYVSAEETDYQIASRAKRLGLKMEGVFMLSTNNITEIYEKHGYDLIIVDSIQMMTHSDITGMTGAPSQIRGVTNLLVEYAKINDVIVVIVGHITKDGSIAGPKTLEHMVDTVLYMEGDRQHEIRLLKVHKNRFGSDAETGIFEINESGIHSINNLTDFFKDSVSLNMSGSALAIIMEGTRPIALEVQALTNKTSFGYPKRTVSGYSMSRLQVLCAVIQKRMKLNLLEQDVYVNIVSGFSVKEPAADLAICASIVSSYYERPIKPNSVFIGEIGLSGEVRNVSYLKRRIKEAESLGFKNIYSPDNIKKIDDLKKSLL